MKTHIFILYTALYKDRYNRLCVQNVDALNYRGDAIVKYKSASGRSLETSFTTNS